MLQFSVVMLKNESSISYTDRIYTNPEKTRNNQRKELVCYKVSSVNINEIGMFKDFKIFSNFFSNWLKSALFAQKVGELCIEATL